MQEFRASLAHDVPPSTIAPALTALWWAGKNDWVKAHEIAQSVETKDGAWVHAHLHRVEGDLGNAAYWYRSAGRPVESGALADEWNAIIEVLLHQ
ncbi:MAG: hypothetical protein JO237_11065 [Pseudolabrys sp.]|nr:hypothetical protein [Pseudolabrys sp.]